MTTGGVFHSQRERERPERERFSRIGCMPPCQVYYVEFQEAQEQKNLLAM